MHDQRKQSTRLTGIDSSFHLSASEAASDVQTEAEAEVEVHSEADCLPSVAQGLCHAPPPKLPLRLL